VVTLEDYNFTAGTHKSLTQARTYSIGIASIPKGRVFPARGAHLDFASTPDGGGTLVRTNNHADS